MGNRIPPYNKNLQTSYGSIFGARIQWGLTALVAALLLEVAEVGE